MTPEAFPEALPNREQAQHGEAVFTEGARLGAESSY